MDVYLESIDIFEDDDEIQGTANNEADVTDSVDEDEEVREIDTLPVKLSTRSEIMSYFQKLQIRDESTEYI